jgi:ketosteroid isomerase-like protein
MSEENVEIVRKGLKGVERDDIEMMLRDVAPDLVTQRHEVDAATYHGPEGLLEAYMEWTEGFDEFTMTGEEFIDAGGNQVLVRVHQQAVGSKSGVPIEADFWFLYTLRDQRTVRLDMYPQKAQALEAAGLSE